jgi:superfamily I DNA/RNA helicase
LTEEQKKAIITDEWHTLVVAVAGTGKTSTIIGKRATCCRKASPDTNINIIRCVI